MSRIVCFLFFLLSLPPSYANPIIDRALSLVKLQPQEAIQIIKPIDYDQLSPLEQIQYATVLASALGGQGKHQAFAQFIDSYHPPVISSRKEQRALFAFQIQAAWPYEQQAEYDNALKWYQEAEKTALELEDMESVGFIKIQYSAVYSQQGNFYQALEQAQQAYKLLATTSDQDRLLNLLSQLGILYYLNQNYPLAIEYQERVLELAETQNDKHATTLAYYNLANAYMKLGLSTGSQDELVQSLDWFDKAYINVKEASTRYLEPDVLLGLIALHTELSNLQKAEGYVTALKALNATYVGYSQLSHALTLASFFFATGEYSISQVYLQTATNYFQNETQSYPIYAINQLKKAAGIYHRMGLNEQAYLTQRQFDRLAEIYYQNNIQKELAFLQSELDNQRLQHENNVLSHHNQMNQVGLISSAFVLVMVLTLLGGQYRQKQQFYRLSNTDHLTGVPNRRYLFELGEQNFAPKQLSVILFDIDFFKQINDKFGHDTGDTVLKEVAALAKSCLRNQDLLGRIGGEEFLVLLPSLTLHELNHVAERLRASIDGHNFYDINGSKVNVTASFGVHHHNQALSLDQAFKLSDQALYNAKRNGRNCCVCC
ncbi:tetratricopeptide repeat-containing diguanylate cyclase [Vibrio sp. TRT 17S01]|uniref:tetratricopeptide repeat-containing diguanylate cyclase n=1 Tax=Vibrio sp. TRT 17S01 TaxID=3418505 RepID=UPI003CE6CF29